MEKKELLSFEEEPHQIDERTTHHTIIYILFRKPENIYDRKKKNYNILIHISCGKSTTYYFNYR